MQWREHGGLRWLEAELPAERPARVAFSTRIGGISEPPYDSLNLSYKTGDQAPHVRTNRLRLAVSLGLNPRAIAIARQVHGATLRLHRWPQNPPAYSSPIMEAPEADGQVTGVAGLGLCVLVADCLPVALAGARGVAMLHCGWRGLAEGIIARGATVVKATHAAIGPGIGRASYEVGAEVLERFALLGPEVVEGDRLDLALAARRLLEVAEVEQVQSADLCTAGNPELFYSHRRDGPQTGRQAGIAWIPASKK